MRALLLRLLRVPPEPHPPAGEQVRVFRAAPNFFRYKAVLWVIGQIGAITGLVFGLLMLRVAEREIGEGTAVSLIRFFEVVGWITVIAQIPLTWAVMRLDWELRWYIVTDRSLRIREGITKVVEKTMTFRNIQNIAIRQGPIQRALGIADLEVRTAGGGGAAAGAEKKAGGAGEDMHVAYFRGVGNAAEIRDLIRSRIRQHRDAGLGDPDDETQPDESGAVEAAREVLEEARALHRALAGPS
ncbi:MAG TPA: PH domain-containing protein [Thermoanaerobaculia bacterium]|nr:PH domain-containing protein [Thermoanaerobaculia bacterium]